jgi:hypothetical protein
MQLWLAVAVLAQMEIQATVNLAQAVQVVVELLLDGFQQHQPMQSVQEELHLVHQVEQVETAEKQLILG